MADDWPFKPASDPKGTDMRTALRPSVLDPKGMDNRMAQSKKIIHHVKLFEYAGPFPRALKIMFVVRTS
jgi:hypothetical protein